MSKILIVVGYISYMLLKGRSVAGNVRKWEKELGSPVATKQIILLNLKKRRNF